MQTKYIFMTGGVCSGLGKGITAASLGRLLKARGYRVTIQKFDPYINMYPGMLNPDQHGEVYVTEDGAEVDLDLGHYERFIDENLNAGNSVSAGRIYTEVLNTERRGGYKGSTIQVIPHITNVIKQHICRAGGNSDIIISEIGGTVGDIESLPFLEAIRQIQYDEGAANVMYVHVTLVPYLSFADEMKTKPSQHAVKELLSLGIRPDALVCRTEKPISDDLKDKLALFCNVDKDSIIENANVDSIYEVPLLLEAERFADIVCKRLQLDPPAPDLTEWAGLVAKSKAAAKTVNIGLVCKYELRDAYLSVLEALNHAGIFHNVKVNTKMIHAERIWDNNAASYLAGLDGIIIPGGYGSRGVQGQISAARYARENKIPFLGIGQGMQCAVLDFARNVAGITNADSAEDKSETQAAVIDHITPPSMDAETKPPMRKGAQPCKLNPESQIHTAYGEALIYERFRHLYKLNNKYRGELAAHNLIEAAHSPDDQFVEAVELPRSQHPWFVGVQFRPEFKSRITRPSPLFKAFLGAVLGEGEDEDQNRGALPHTPQAF
ncbi:MAG: CTP synthase [Defluviitaleaceae bacterium]|nr:CTP synthase [Defluviitaleaceae bacterium]